MLTQHWNSLTIRWMVTCIAVWDGALKDNTKSIPLFKAFEFQIHSQKHRKALEEHTEKIVPKTRADRNSASTLQIWEVILINGVQNFVVWDRCLAQSFHFPKVLNSNSLAEASNSRWPIEWIDSTKKPQQQQIATNYKMQGHPNTASTP